MSLAALTFAACTPPAPPNVLLVTLDTTRADRLSPYGFGGGTTPVLDAFAKTAVVYERAYATSSWTLPSHASLFTGALPMEHGAQSVAGAPARMLGYGVRPLESRFETLAERLSAAGYRTAAVIGGPALHRDLGVAQGFERYDDALEQSSAGIRERRAEAVADRAVAWIQEFGAEPWFLFANFFDPHAPYRPPPPHDRDVPEVDMARLVEALFERLERGSGAASPDALAQWERETLAALLIGYDAEIAYVDAQLGRILEALAASPRADETLVAITADHGESFGEHGYVSHGAHLYEDNVQVPLLIRRPGKREAGRRVAKPVQNHRLFATILRAARLEVPVGRETLEADGAPIVTEVHASDANIRLFGAKLDRDLYAFYRHPHKLVLPSAGPMELYDLEADPSESAPIDIPSLAHELRLLHSLVLRDQLRKPGPEARVEIDPSTAEALRELGYAD